MMVSLDAGCLPHREGVVLLAYDELAQKHYIVTKVASRTQLVHVDPQSGALVWEKAKAKSTFESEAAALAFLQAHAKVEVVAHGKAVLGYVVLGPVGLLLLADSVRVAAVLPGGHEIKTVTQSRWHRINLQQAEPDLAQVASKVELEKGIEKLTSFPIDGAHFFCETLDITRPFPSEKPVSEPSWPFVWNRWLSLSFRSAGLDQANTVCPALLQGMAEGRELEDFDGKRFSYCLISRRCRLHVGPRYKARGLNENADPGNEIECDQVVWKHVEHTSQPLAWSRYTWRRGSVPLWWTVNIRNGGMGEAEIKIRNVNTFKGSRRYVRRLQKRYVPNPHLDPDPQLEESGNVKDPAAEVPIVFFSLLRKGTPDRDRSEAKLAEAFDFMASQVRVQHKLPVTYIALDWHQLDKELGSEKLVEAFWTQLSAVIPQQGFALGTMFKVNPDVNVASGPELNETGSAHLSSNNRCCTMAGTGWEVRWYRQQRGVTRYNCADSLDRTNVGSFFGAVQVFVEQCRELDIAIAATSAGAASVARQALIRRQAAAVPTAGGTTTGARPSVAPLPGPLSNGAEKCSSTSSSSSGFLSSFGKEVSRGLNTMMGDLRVSPKTSPRDLRDLRVASAPNMMPQPLSGSTGGSSTSTSSGGSTPGVAAALGSNEGTGKVPAGVQAGSDDHHLPPGWEAKFDMINRRIFYVDHNCRTTTWDRPIPVADSLPVSSVARTGAVCTAAGVAGVGSALPFREWAGPLVGSGGNSGTSSNSMGWAEGGNCRTIGAIPPKSPGPGSVKKAAADGAVSDHDGTTAEKGRYEPLTPWCMLTCAKVSYFARRINPSALSAIAELFLMNGDMCAWLYTGSPAMHSEKITLFEPENSRLKKAGAGSYSNSLIAIKRRYNNVVMDDERKQQVETFLGVKSRAYFPTFSLCYRDDEKIDDDYPESGDDQDPLGLLGWPAADKKERASMSHVGELADLAMERYSSHARSFSSEKIMQEFQTLQRLGASMAGDPVSVVPLSAVEGPVPEHQHMFVSNRDKRSVSEPRGASAQAGVVAGACTVAMVAAADLSTFDEGVPDGTPGPLADRVAVGGQTHNNSSSATSHKPFADPLGLL